MKFLILLLALYTTCDATLLTLLRRKLGLLFPPTQAPPTYHPIPPNIYPGSFQPVPSNIYPSSLPPVPVNYPGNIYPPKHSPHPITYTIVPTGVAGPAVVHSGVIPPGEHTKNPLPLGGNYNLVHGPGAVLNINTRSKDGWGYALQPIPNSQHTPAKPDNSINHLTTEISGGPTLSEIIFDNAPLYNPHASTHKDYDVTKGIFTVNEKDVTKFDGPVHVGEYSSHGSDKDEYHRSYTLDDGTLVEENGKLSAQPDGNVVFVKNGEYQYKRDDGELVTVRWEADEHGFRIVN